MGLDRSAFKWAALSAVAAGALFAAASANAEVSWSIGIGAPVYVAPAPVYTAPPPVYYQPAPRVYYAPPQPVYERREPVYYGPPTVYYEPDYRSGYRYRYRHRDHRDWDDHDD